MPTGPKRPTGVVGNATSVAEKNPAAVELGRMGGTARAKGMSPERQAEIAKKAAANRWKSKSRQAQ
jgi:hypothetical protein